MLYTVSWPQLLFYNRRPSEHDCVSNTSFLTTNLQQKQTDSKISQNYIIGKTVSEVTHITVSEVSHITVRGQPHNCIMGQSHNCVRDQLHNYVRGQSYNCIRGQSHNYVRGQLHNCVRGLLHNCIRGQSYNCVRGQSHNCAHEPTGIICSEIRPANWIIFILAMFQISSLVGP